MPDILGVIVTLSRVQSDLRAVMSAPDRYPPDGHYDDVVNLTTALHGQVQHWMAAGAPDRRHATRRQDERRREADRRHDERQPGPSTDRVV